MEKPLSIKASSEEIEIRASKGDYLAALVRGILGAAPCIGPMAAELLTSQIPNQKLDRVIIFMKLLEDKLKYVEQDVVKQRFMSEEFADLLEDALPQASRALTPQRREYLANLLKNGLTDDALQHLGKKKLLVLLNELNDAEVMLLHFYAVRVTDKERALNMLDRYPFIKTAIEWSSLAQSPSAEDVLFGEYQGKIVMTNLLMGPVDNHYPTPLGYLLLRYIEPTTE